MLRYRNKGDDEAILNLKTVTPLTKAVYFDLMKEKATSCHVWEDADTIFGVIIYTFHPDNIEIVRLIVDNVEVGKVLVKWVERKITNRHEMIITSPIDVRDYVGCNVFKELKYRSQGIHRGGLCSIP